jgi:predicted extracellular nuclease
LVENFEELVVSANHLKSKGSSCVTGDDDKRTGQVNCNLTRTAHALTAFNSEQFGTTPALIIGDLNAYTKEDPISAIIGEGYMDLANYFGGAEAHFYSFDGQLGYLDQALTSASMLDKVVDTTEWYINADEPIVLDYNLDFQCATQIDKYFVPDTYRMSEHDPVVVSLPHFLWS